MHLTWDRSKNSSFSFSSPFPHETHRHADLVPVSFFGRGDDVWSISILSENEFWFSIPHVSSHTKREAEIQCSEGSEFNVRDREISSVIQMSGNVRCIQRKVLLGGW